MTLVPHLLYLFTKSGIEANINVGPAICHEGERKEVARELRRKVMALRA